MHVLISLLTYNNCNFLTVLLESHVLRFRLQIKKMLSIILFYFKVSVCIFGTTQILNKQGYGAASLGSKMQFYFVWKEIRCKPLTNG